MMIQLLLKDGEEVAFTGEDVGHDIFTEQRAMNIFYAGQQVVGPQSGRQQGIVSGEGRLNPAQPGGSGQDGGNQIRPTEDDVGARCKCEGSWAIAGGNDVQVDETLLLDESFVARGVAVENEQGVHGSGPAATWEKLCV
jgi:hypothetical protein